jgi:hypothetical protein
MITGDDVENALMKWYDYLDDTTPQDVTLVSVEMIDYLHDIREEIAGWLNAKKI